jgi:hypothetical protein
MNKERYIMIKRCRNTRKQISGFPIRAGQLFFLSVLLVAGCVQAQDAPKAFVLDDFEGPYLGSQGDY